MDAGFHGWFKLNGLLRQKPQNLKAFLQLEGDEIRGERILSPPPTSFFGLNRLGVSSTVPIQKQNRRSKNCACRERAKTLHPNSGLP